MSKKLPPHIVQSPEWGKFKTAVGKKAVIVNGVQFFLHPLPKLPYHIGYCPKVDPEQIDWTAIKKAGRENRCFAIRFDCPNVIKTDSKPSFENSLKLGFENRPGLIKAPRNTFAKQTLLLDLTKSEEELLAGMKSKTRYNLRYAQRHGIWVKEESNEEGVEHFIKLQAETTQRQGFFVHPDSYYRQVWETLAPHGMVKIITAYHQNDPEPLVSWMLFIYEGVLYYPYGGSSTKHRSLFPSNLVMWEAIKLGQRLDCHTFDLWGATPDQDDPWWGFTRFKLGFGAEMVEFIDSYDLVLNPLLYWLFVAGYWLFWKYMDLYRHFPKPKTAGKSTNERSDL